MIDFFMWLLGIEPYAKVTAERTPYGINYTVTFADRAYGTSADGTLWYPLSGKTVPGFAKSEQCRRIVRRALNNGLKPVDSPTWDALLDEMDPDFKHKLLAGAAKGQENAILSGLLP